MVLCVRRYHHVTALPPDPSLSLSMWTASADDVSNDAAEHLPLPLDTGDDWPLPRTHAVAACFVWELLKHLQWDVAAASPIDPNAPSQAAQARATLQAMQQYRFPFLPPHPTTANNTCSHLSCTCPAADRDKTVSRARAVAEWFNRMPLTATNSATTTDPDRLASKQTYVFGYLETLWEVVLDLRGTIGQLPYCLQRMTEVC
jgi:hypothetical protein